MFSWSTGICFSARPRRELGRSMTRRGGESTVWISGITGPPLVTISTAGTPRSCTMRTLLMVGGGPKVWAAARQASTPTTSIGRKNWNTGRSKDSSLGRTENISLAEDGRKSRTRYPSTQGPVASHGLRTAGNLLTENPATDFLIFLILLLLRFWQELVF